MVLGEWQRSGYRRRVFFFLPDALRHSQTTRVEAQELAAAVYWLVLGRQRSRALPLKIPPFCFSPPLRDHFHRGRAIEESRAKKEESNNLELRSVSYADRKFGEASPDQDYFFWELLMPLPACAGRCSQAEKSTIKTWISVRHLAVPS